MYSLGVLLYELLTGTTPLEGERLRTAGYAEMQRLIREEEPPKPSTRLSTSGEKLTILAKHRKVTPEKLKSQVKGDLDWIVMKALEKDRNRRYESPSVLAGEISCYISHRPISARPPTLAYRAAKAWQVHRAAIVLTAIVVSMLSIALAVVSTQSSLLRVANSDLHQQKEEAHRAAKKAREAEELAIRETSRYREMLFFADLNRAQREINRGFLPAAREILAGNQEYVSASRRSPGFAWNYLLSQTRSGEGNVIHSWDGPALDVAFSSAGLLAIAHFKSIALFDTRNGRELPGYQLLTAL